ncbi:hypothetical protein BN174_3420002 [Clostridioides difficile E15]|nr:hypothetical protein BN174_3420002 [Clostridioides difficile E15]CCL39572.1 hypothetical protein BN176_290025 [Clostridioides difficile E19]
MPHQPCFYTMNNVSHHGGAGAVRQGW